MSAKQDLCLTDSPESDSSSEANEDQSIVEHPPTGAAVDRVNPKRSLELAIAAVKTAAENGGSDLLLLDMSPHTAIFDYFVIATGTSRRQLHAMSEEIDHCLEEKMNDKRMNVDGYAESRWIVLDYGTVVIHLFEEEARENYALESLWADAIRVDLTETLKHIR